MAWCMKTANGIGNQQKDNSMFFRGFGDSLLYFGVHPTDLLNDDKCSRIWLAMRHESSTLSCITFWTV